jgi:hypothetical protein
MRHTRIEAIFNDAYDGIIRLMTDAQRFGLHQEALNVSRDSLDNYVASLRLALPDEMVDADLVARFARHPAIRRIQAANEREAAAE